MFWLVVVLTGCFGVGAIFGAPFLPVRRVDMEAALDLADLKPGERFIDLGSGDGRLLVAAAKRGATAIGYEINPLLYVWSKIVTWKHRKRVSIRLQSYWNTQLPEADVIYTFLLDRYMDRLHHKLIKQVARPTRVVCYVFELPQTPVKQTRNTFLYHYGDLGQQ